MIRGRGVREHKANTYGGTRDTGAFAGAAGSGCDKGGDARVDAGALTDVAWVVVEVGAVPLLAVEPAPEGVSGGSADRPLCTSATTTW